MPDKTKEELKHFKDKAVDSAKDIKDKAKSAVKDVQEKTKDALKDAKDKAEEKADDARKKVHEATHRSPLEKVQDKLSDAANAIKDKISDATKGFTIIEVVLVLAIAGLIFLMVFIALPALQRSQKNTQRENDISRFLTAVQDFQSNNNGNTPFSNGTTDSGFIKRYIDENVEAYHDNGAQATCATGDNGCAQFRDPDGEMYGFTVQDFTPNNGDNMEVKIDEMDHLVHVVVGAGCSGSEGVASRGNGKREIAMFFHEEGGSIICNDNH